ncbi:MAG: hypothetical protein AAGA62_19785, partial [Bacteroidota bacterium]
MADLTIQLKRLGKKKVHIMPYTIPPPATLAELIAACVRAEIAAYNARREEVRLLPFLTPAEMDEQSTTGKIGFGDLENHTLAVEEQSIEVARQGFLDGLFTVFVDEDEIIELETPLSLTEASVITFLRLTFLSGTYW